MKSWSEWRFFFFLYLLELSLSIGLIMLNPTETKKQEETKANVSYQHCKCIQEILKQEIKKYWSNGLYLNSFLEISSSVINSIHPSPFSFYFSQTMFCSSFCFFSFFVCQVIFKVTLLRSERITEKLSKVPFYIFIRTLSGQSPRIFLFFLPRWITATFHKLLWLHWEYSLWTVDATVIHWYSTVEVMNT